MRRHIYMSEEEKKIADAAKAEADKAEKEKADAEFEESLADLSDEEKEAKRTERSKVENPIDYKAEAEKERQKRIEAEQLIAKNKLLKKKEKEADADEDDEDDEDKPLTRREYNKLAERDNKERLAQTAFQVARTLATSDAEAELIVEKWRGRSFPSHLSLNDQIEESYAVTHAKRMIGERNEALRALRNKDNVNNDGSGTHRDALDSGIAPKIAPDMKLAITQSKLVLNPATKRYERKLPSGKSLVYDAKSKTVILV